ncbi:MAG TPA: cytochrome c oxidase subunit 3 [Solirubrobacteraceae bacterium]|nr:cytochrome c oxidase subunit 3 [Solirubrobacteraceae bacterium]
MAWNHEPLPPQAITPPVAPGVEIPPEPPTVSARALYVAGRLLAGATAFFFLAFVFAYFYLRALDQDRMWHPAHVNPDQALGAAILACAVLSALAAGLASRQLGRESHGWVGPACGSLALGLVAVALQCIAYTSQGFGPTDGAYASVFCAWTALFAIAVLATMYWLETHVATGLRARRTRGSHPDIADPDRLIQPGMEACAFYWMFLAGIGVLAWVVLYLV